MRALPVALLLVASLMAGCTGAGDDDPPNGGGTLTPPNGGGGTTDPPEPPEPVTERPLLNSFTFDGCTGVRVEAMVDLAAAQALLPEGYEPVQTSAIPIPGSERAVAGAHLYNCTSFTAGDFAFDDVHFGMAWVEVEMPVDGIVADEQLYIVEMIATEDILAALWPAAGYPMFNGTASDEDEPYVRTMDAGDYTLESSKEAPAVDVGASGSFVWYHELDDGDRLTWTGDQEVDGDTGGAGSIILPDDSGMVDLASGPGMSNLFGEGAVVDGATFFGMDLVQELADYRD